MRILIVNPILHTHEKGAIPVRETNHDCMIYGMARGFVANGHDVTVAASEEYRCTEPEDNPFEVVYFPSRMPRVFQPWRIPWPKGLGRYIREHRFDLVFSSEVFSMGTLIACRNAKCPVVAWQEQMQHNRHFHEIPSKIWYGIVTRLMMRRVIAVGRSLPARDFISRYCPRTSPETVDHGCDGDVFYPSDHADDSFVIIARLVEGKKPLVILDAFLKFIRKPGFENYRLDVIGDGPMRQPMEERVRQAGAEGNVAFHGFMSHRDFAPISRRAKGMLINTVRDSNMVSVSEAIANGTPVLMNSVPYIAPFIRDNGVGIVRDGWNEDTLEELARGYGRFHEACVRIGKSFTSTAGAEKIVHIAENM